jgi:uncharacterized protein YjbI with pentapeptide repeats
MRLAFEMSRLGSRELTPEQVQAVAEDDTTFKALGAMELGGRSLLNKTSNGSYRFAHYSFQEFLLAEAILMGRSFRKLNAGVLRITQQVLGFMLQASERETILVLSYMDLRELDFTDASLRCTNFSGSDLRGTKLERAQLDGSLFNGANLRGADFGSASLRSANFSGTSLDGCNLSGADVSDAVFFHEDLNRLSGVVGQARQVKHNEVPLVGGGVIHRHR